MSRHVCIALISHKGEPCLPVMEYLQREMLQIEGATIAYTSLTGNPMLPHGRNTLVSNFLARGASDLILMDDDNYPENGGLKRLLSHDVDVCGIPVRTKQDEEKWNIRWLLDRPMERSANGLMEVECVGTGILKISRACIERMVHAQGNRWYHDTGSDTGRAWPIFEYEVRDHMWLGEDIVFCQRWRDMGGQVWVDPDVTTHHIGKATYSGSVGDWARRMPASISIHGDPVNVQNRMAG